MPLILLLSIFPARNNWLVKCSLFFTFNNILCKKYLGVNKNRDAILISIFPAGNNWLYTRIHS